MGTLGVPRYQGHPGPRQGLIKGNQWLIVLRIGSPFIQFTERCNSFSFGCLPTWGGMWEKDRNGTEFQLLEVVGTWRVTKYQRKEWSTHLKLNLYIYIAPEKWRVFFFEYPCLIVTFWPIFKWASLVLNFQRVGKCRVHGNGFNMFLFVHFQLQKVEEDGKSLVLVNV